MSIGRVNRSSSGGANSRISDCNRVGPAIAAAIASAGALPKAAIFSTVSRCLSVGFVRSTRIMRAELTSVIRPSSAPSRPRRNRVLPAPFSPYRTDSPSWISIDLDSSNGSPGKTMAAAVLTARGYQQPTLLWSAPECYSRVEPRRRNFPRNPDPMDLLGRAARLSHPPPPGCAARSSSPCGLATL